MNQSKKKPQWRPHFPFGSVIPLAQECVYTGFIQLHRLRLQFPLFEGGLSAPIHREVAVRPRAVAVLLYDPDAKQVVLIGQFRAGALYVGESPWLLETVAGVVEVGQSPEEAAIREVAEETGLTVLSLIPLYTYLPSPAILSEQVFLYCAKVKSPLVGGIHGLKEESEDIKVHVFSLADAFAALKVGLIVSAPALLSLQWLELHHTTLVFSQ